MKRYIDLTPIKESVGVSLDVAYAEDASELGFTDLNLVNKVVISARLTNMGSFINVQEEIQFELTLECIRCLSPFVLPVKTTFEVDYYQKMPLPEVVEAALTEEDLRSVYYTDNRIDLMEEIRQDIILATPVSPLCQENCQGLCLSCGQNLNIGKCNCQSEEIESPWSSLKKLLEE
ncbi:MAG: DUF177 domain-containing protein [bacterium]|nr:DUF177 domain-containing protein [bacterium]